MDSQRKQVIASKQATGSKVKIETHETAKAGEFEQNETTNIQVLPDSWASKANQLRSQTRHDPTYDKIYLNYGIDAFLLRLEIEAAEKQGIESGKLGKYLVPSTRLREAIFKTALTDTKNRLTKEQCAALKKEIGSLNFSKPFTDIAQFVLPEDRTKGKSKQPTTFDTPRPMNIKVKEYIPTQKIEDQVMTNTDDTLNISEIQIVKELVFNQDDPITPTYNNKNKSKNKQDHQNQQTDKKVDKVKNQNIVQPEPPDNEENKSMWRDPKRKPQYQPTDTDTIIPNMYPVQYDKYTTILATVSTMAGADVFTWQERNINCVAFVVHWDRLHTFAKYTSHQEQQSIMKFCQCLQQINITQYADQALRIQETLKQSLVETSQKTMDFGIATVYYKDEYDAPTLELRKINLLNGLVMRDTIDPSQMRFTQQGQLIIDNTIIKEMNQRNRLAFGKQQKPKFSNGNVFQTNVKPNIWDGDVTRRPTALSKFDYAGHNYVNSEDSWKIVRGSYMQNHWNYSELFRLDQQSIRDHNQVQSQSVKIYQSKNGPVFTPCVIYEFGGQKIILKQEYPIIRSIAKALRGYSMAEFNGERKVWSLQEVEREIFKYTNLCLYHLHGICIHPECPHAHPTDYKSILYYYRTAVKNVQRTRFITEDNIRSEIGQVVEQWYWKINSLFKKHTGIGLGDYQRTILLQLKNGGDRELPRFIRQYLLGCIADDDIALKTAVIKLQYQLQDGQYNKLSDKITTECEAVFAKQKLFNAQYNSQLCTNVTFKNQDKFYVSGKAFQIQSHLTMRELRAATCGNYNLYHQDGNSHNELHDYNYESSGFSFNDTHIFQDLENGFFPSKDASMKGLRQIPKNIKAKVTVNSEQEYVDDYKYKNTIYDYATGSQIKVVSMEHSYSKIKVLRGREEINYLANQMTSDPILAESIMETPRMEINTISPMLDMEMLSFTGTQWKVSNSSNLVCKHRVDDYIKNRKLKIETMEKSLKMIQVKNSQVVKEIRYTGLEDTMMQEEKEDDDTVVNEDPTDVDPVYMFQEELAAFYKTLTFEQRIDLALGDELLPYLDVTDLRISEEEIRKSKKVQEKLIQLIKKHPHMVHYITFEAIISIKINGDTLVCKSAPLGTQSKKFNRDRKFAEAEVKQLRNAKLSQYYQKQKTIMRPKEEEFFEWEEAVMALIKDEEVKSISAQDSSQNNGSHQAVEEEGMQ